MRPVNDPPFPRDLTEAEMAALTPEEREEEIAALRAGALRRLKALRQYEAIKAQSKTSSK